MNKIIISLAMATTLCAAPEPAPKHCCKTGTTCCKDDCCKPSDNCCKAEPRKACTKECKKEEGGKGISE